IRRTQWSFPHRPHRSRLPVPAQPNCRLKTSFTGFFETLFRTLCQDDPDANDGAKGLFHYLMAVSILIVDDDPVQRRLLQAAVIRFGYDAVVSDSGEAALAMLETGAGAGVDAMILDLAMPGIDGLGVLKAMRERDISIPVIVQTAQGGIEIVVSAMRAGAFDFVVKPASPERLRVAIASALKVEALEVKARQSARRGAGVITFRDIVTRSPAMDRVIRLAQKAAASNIPILIEGESGVGKELVARAIQGAGERKSKP